ncbi:MAG: hypothetical protein ACKV2U_04000 [Bryobacteraceae bacterium]
MLGILVHGDNHFIVDGPPPDRESAFALVRQWSVIQIGGVPPIPGWEIRTKAFREDLEWAVIVPGQGANSVGVVELLAELTARGIAVQTWSPVDAPTQSMFLL